TGHRGQPRPPRRQRHRAHPMELTPKRLEVFKAAIPSLGRVGIIWIPNTIGPEIIRTARIVADTLGVELIPLAVQAYQDFAAAFNATVREALDGLLVGRNPLTSNRMREIVGFTAAT